MWKLGGQALDFSLNSFAESNWITIIILFVFLLLTINAVVYRREFIMSLQCLYSKRAFSQLIKEGKPISDGSFVFSLPVVVLAFSLSLIQLTSFFVPTLQNGMPYPQFFGITALIVLGVYFLKNAIDFFLFEIFDHVEEAESFHRMEISFLINASLVLFAVFMLVQYTDIYAFYLLAAALIGALFLLKLYKNVFFVAKRVNLFQFFVYFCTLEIIPCVVIVKLLFF